MVTSDFTLEMKMWPFRACTMKNMQYNRRYLQPNQQNFHVLQENVVKVHDGDVILYTGLGNGADCMSSRPVKEKWATYWHPLPLTSNHKVHAKSLPILSYQQKSCF